MIDNSTTFSKKRTFDSSFNDFDQEVNFNHIIPDIISKIFMLNFSLAEFKPLATVCKSLREFARDMLIKKIELFKINEETFSKQLDIEIIDFLANKIPFSRPLGMAEAYHKAHLTDDLKINSFSKIYLKIISKTYEHFGHKKSLSLFTTCKAAHRTRVMHCYFRHSRIIQEHSFLNLSAWLAKTRITLNNIQNDNELKRISNLFFQEALLFSVDAFFLEKVDTEQNNWQKLFSKIFKFNLKFQNFNFFPKTDSISFFTNTVHQVSSPFVHYISRNIYRSLENSDLLQKSSKVLNFLKLIPDQIFRNQLGKSLCYRFFQDNFSSILIPDQWHLTMEISRITGLSQKYAKIIFKSLLINDRQKLVEIFRSSDPQLVKFQMDFIKLLEKYPNFLFLLFKDNNPPLQIPIPIKLELYLIIIEFLLSKEKDQLAICVIAHFPNGLFRQTLELRFNNFFNHKDENKELESEEFKENFTDSDTITETSQEGVESLENFEIDIEKYEEDADKTLSYYSDLDLSA